MVIGISYCGEVPNVDNFQKFLSTPKKKRTVALGTVEYYDVTPLATPWQAKKIEYEDVLWAARMIEKEGGGKDPEHGAAVLWTLISRGWCNSGYSKPTFTGQFQAFSQPINPLWSCVSGDLSACAQFCVPGRSDYIDPDTLDCDDSAHKQKKFCPVKYRDGQNCETIPADKKFKAGPPFTFPNGITTLTFNACDQHPCSGHRLAERNDIVNRRWDKLSRGAREVAMKWAMGELPNPLPGAVNFVNNCGAGRVKELPKKGPEPERIYLASYKASGKKADEKSRHCCSNVNSMYAEKCNVNGTSIWSHQVAGTPVKLVPPDYVAIPYVPKGEGATTRSNPQ
jgi:hypothetical protein